MNTDPKIILARVQAGKAKSAAELPGRLEAVQAQSQAARNESARSNRCGQASPSPLELAACSADKLAAVRAMHHLRGGGNANDPS